MPINTPSVLLVQAKYAATALYKVYAGTTSCVCSRHSSVFPARDKEMVSVSWESYMISMARGVVGVGSGGVPGWCVVDVLATDDAEFIVCKWRLVNVSAGGIQVSTHGGCFCSRFSLDFFSSASIISSLDRWRRGTMGDTGGEKLEKLISSGYCRSSAMDLDLLTGVATSGLFNGFFKLVMVVLRIVDRCRA